MPRMISKYAALMCFCLIGLVGVIDPAIADDVIERPSVSATIPPNPSLTADSDWSSVFGPAGVDLPPGDVRAVAIYQGDLVIAGDFIQGRGTITNHLARWNGTRWMGFGSGLGPNLVVTCLAVAGDTLYIGGAFSHVDGVSGYNGVARWDGSAWSVLGSGVSPINTSTPVRAIAVSGSTVFVGGDFTSAGGISDTDYIASWTSAAGWSSLGTGVNGVVNALHVQSSVLYVGGGFSLAGATTVANTATWSGGAWSAMAKGVNGAVYAFTPQGGSIAVGGDFTQAENLLGGPFTVNRVALWNGTSWSALSSGFSSGRVYALQDVSGTLVAGGSFPDSLRAYSGSSWAPYTSPAPNGIVYAIGIYGSPSRLVVGGAFTAIKGVAVACLAKETSTTWEAFGSGMTQAGAPSHRIYGLLAWDWTGDIYTTGSFSYAGALDASNVARWDGTAWSSLGAGIAGPGKGLCRHDDTLVVVGDFTAVNSGTTAYRVAKWIPSTSTWSHFGPTASAGGFSHQAKGALVFGGQVYAWGDFATTQDGAVALKGLARWTGGVWQAVGNWTSFGSSGKTVRALAVHGGVLYAADSDNKILSLSGSTWNAVAYVNSQINTMLSHNGLLYFGGEFSTMGTSNPPSTNVNHIATFNAGTLSIFGSGLNGYPHTMYSYHGDLIVGGNFGADGNNNGTLLEIARWDGAAWISMGASGPLNDIAYALAVRNNDLYVGGAFLKAGGKPSFLIARYSEADAKAPAAIADLMHQNYCEHIDLFWTAPGDDGLIGPVTGYILARSSSPINAGNFASATPTYLGATALPGGLETYSDEVGPCSGNLYYAIKAVDDASNAGAISNLPSVTSTPCPPPDCEEARIESSPIAVDALELKAPSPNPTSGPFVVEFLVPQELHGNRVRLGVYDAAGRRVAQLADGPATAGRNVVRWNAAVERNRLSAGIYFVNLEIGATRLKRTLIMVR